MPPNLTNLQDARQKKRKKNGWSLSEIEKRAAEERALYKKLAKNEPDELASGGDMKKILEESDDEQI